MQLMVDVCMCWCCHLRRRCRLLLAAVDVFAVRTRSQKYCTQLTYVTAKHGFPFHFVIRFVRMYILLLHFMYVWLRIFVHFPVVVIVVVERCTLPLRTRYKIQIRFITIVVDTNLENRSTKKIKKYYDIFPRTKCGFAISSSIWCGLHALILFFVVNFHSPR